MPDLSALVATRQAWHVLAEWVLAPRRVAVDGHIGLVPAAGGFATPDLRLGVVGGDLVVDGRAAPITTLAEAADRAGVPPGTHSGAYEPVTAWRADEPLTIDPAAATLLAEWFALGAAVLRRFEGAAPATLWPEHFDLATTVGEVNVGASPGDGGHPLPYLYVGPRSTDGLQDPYWNEPFGASLPWSPDVDEAAALAFFREGLGRL